MSEEITTDTTDTETTEEAQPQPVEETEAPVTEEPDILDTGKAGREAAKYRRQLREVESERDQLKAHLTSAREDALGSLLAFQFEVDYVSKYTTMPGKTDAQLHHPEDFTRFTGLTADDLTTEDGKVDRVRVAEAVNALYQERPELFRKWGKPIPSVGDTPDGDALRRLMKNNFTAAFAPDQQ